MERKKLLISLIAGSCALITIGGASLVALQLIGNKNTSASGQKTTKKPLNRGSNYEHCELTRPFFTNAALSQVVDKKLKDGEWVKTINEEKFKNFIKNNIHSILQKIPAFSKNAEYYEVDIHYQIGKSKSDVLLDIDWNLPKSNYHYYDQLRISF